MKKRFLAALLILVMAFSSLNGFAPVEAENALTEEKMKEVLIEVKSKIDIGDEFTEFDYSYNEYSGKGRFYFNWNTEDSTDSISITADGDGRIWSYSRYLNNYNTQDSVLPTYIGEELIPKAEEWIYQAEPGLKGKLDITRCSYQTYRKSYYIGFTRIENGIRMNDNYVSISLDAMDGKVLSYSLNWNFEVEIPKVDKPIGEKKAAEKVDDTVKMQLEYRLGYDDDGKEKVFLAYNPDITYVAVDAKNGKVYTTRTYWGSSSEFDDGFNTAAATESADGEYLAENGKTVRLSDNEIKKIDEVKDILTSEEAVNLIKKNKKLYIDQNLNTARCRLYFQDGEYYWSISLSDNRPIDYDKYNYYSSEWYRASASASINAKTGKLISFYASTRDYYSYDDEGDDKFVANYSKKQCQKLFEEFAKETDPEEFKSVKLADTYEDKVYIYREIYSGYYDQDTTATGGYSMQYKRYYKDIPFSANGISGAVEAVTGKVTRYNLTWTDAELPEPETAISEKQAFDAYINFDGFDLVYELVSKYEDSGKYYGVDKEVKARLVYRTAISPNFVDAFTGKQLSWNGQEYKTAGVSYKYTDINGTKYERSIKLLADMGLGFEGEEFKPDQKITNAEFEKLLTGNLYRYYGPYITKAYDEDGEEIDPDELTPDDETKVTRQEACKLIISAMGGDKLAQMDIFKTGYSDEKKIDKENIGAVALCKGLDIMGAKSGKKFKPNASITRGEAADLVIRMLSSNF